MLLCLVVVLFGFGCVFVGVVIVRVVCVVVCCVMLCARFRFKCMCIRV